MPALASIGLVDRQATPVTHTFEPVNIKGDVATYRCYDDEGVPLGDKILSVSARETENRINGTLKLSVPVLTSVTGDSGTSYTVARVARVTVTTSFDKESTEQERNDAVGFIYRALQHNEDQVHEVFVENKRAY